LKSLSQFLGGFMKKYLVSLFLLAAFSLLVHCPFVHAQAVGAITGTVTDPSGAVIPGAKVTATRVETRVSQSTVTSGAGTYTIPNLAVGTYTVTAEAGGFKTGIATEITLDVAQQREIGFKLALAGVTSTVEVNAAPPLLNTTSGTMAGVVTGEQVQTLPLNGRSIGNLVMLQPGMAQDTGGMGWLSPMWISNGNRGETAVATLDSADASDAEMGTIQFWNFNLDAIAEFKVQQNNYSAQYGQGAGTITQIVSKSGTNAFHGSAFEFLRNDALDARNFFGASVAPFRRNEFGATFGGPIKKDKTFFFLQYAGYRQTLGEPTVIPVPTAAERQGQITIADPVTGQPDQLQVPLNPVAQEVLSKYPQPNQPNGLFGPNTFNFLYKLPLDTDQGSVRIDEHFSDKDSLFGRFSYGNNIVARGDPVAAVEDPSFSNGSLNNPRSYSISETHLFSPTLLNNFMFTLNRQIEGVPPANQTVPQTTFTDGSLANWGPDTFFVTYVETYFDPQDSLTWTKGRHTFSIGGNYRRGRDNTVAVTSLGPQGVYAFAPGTPLTETIPSINGGTALLAGTASPNGLISMMAGDPFTYGRATTIPGFGPLGGGPAWAGVRRWHLATWIQDDFKATSKLTVNLGLRYEYNSVPLEVANRFGGVADYGNLYGHFVLNPEPLYQPDYLNFAPRLGIAYRATSRTVLRGGFAIFTNTIPTVYPDQTTANFPLASLNWLPNATYSMTPLAVSLPVLTSTSGQPMPPNGNTKLVPPNTPVNLSPISALLGPVGGDYASDRFRNGYTISGNATVERELPGSVDLQVSYVVNNGVHLYNQTYPNAFTGAELQYAPYTQVTPGLGELQVFYNGAYSSYSGLQAQARKVSAEHGIQFQASYTWAKDMTDADAVWSAPGASGGITRNNPQCLKCEYAPASYSVAQRFVGNFAYDVPFAGVQAFSRLPKRLTQGWKLMGIYTIQTGFPFTVVGPYGTLQYGYDSFDGVGARPFFLQQATKNTGGGPQFFSNAVIANNGMNGQFFAVPTTTSPSIGTVQTVPGNLGRNTFTGPGWSNLDFSIVKDTRLTESKMLQFRAEFFNLPNDATFGTPNSTLSNPSFGLATYTATTERVIQFGLRFVF
jgi:hypothetical protein